MKKRKISPLYVIIALTLICVVAVLYVKNIIEVNNLNREIIELKDELQKQNQLKTKLLAEIEILTSRNRIVEFASERLGMEFPKDNIIIIKERN